MEQFTINGDIPKPKESSPIKVNGYILIDEESIEISMKPKRGYKKCGVVFQGMEVDTKFIYVKRGKVRR